MSRHHERDGLQRCLQSWKREKGRDTDRISASSRANILREARRAHSEPADERRFGLLSMPRWVFAAAAPTLTVAVLAGMWTLAIPRGQVGADSTTVVEFTQEIKVSKVGDAIVFEIANGSKVHEVRKSTTPQRFDERTAVTTESGSYSDALNNGVALTFYRID